MTNRAEIRFNGTNGWFDSDIGLTSCVSIHINNDVFLFDAGTGIRRLEPEALAFKNVTIFLSHLHLDHSVGLHFLQRFRPHSLRIVVHAELAQALETLLAPPFTTGFESSPYTVDVLGVNEGGHHNGDLSFSVHELQHSTTVLGYRMIIGDKVFSYCVDTGPCAGLSSAANGSDVFVCDSGLQRGQQSNDRGHMDPEDAIRIAEDSGVRRLVLTHFGCTRYTTIFERLNLLELSEMLSGELLIAYDGMRIVL